MNMNGNPHFEAAIRGEVLMGETLATEGQTDATIIAESQLIHASATLALAYEQRTANLIALWQMDEESAVAFNTANDFDASAWTTVPRQIAARLGLK